MKKISFLVLSLLLIPFSVKAATSPNVKTLEASAKDDTVTYNGTMEEGFYAVMCKLFNDKDEEIDLLSSAVSEGTFTGAFTNVENGTYNVSCANYEGGEFKKAEVIVNYTVADKTNPKTGDNILLYVLTFGVCVAGITGAGTALNKRRKK